jgi:hypothetical protein
MGKTFQGAFALAGGLLFLALPAAAHRAKPDDSAILSAHHAALVRALRFYVYDKSTDVVNDVTGLFDSKSRKITIKCELKNLTRREIHGVRGTVRFSTFFGDKIADVYIQSTAAIPPGRVVGVNWDIPMERLGPEAFKTLNKTKLDQMKQSWYPSMIVFTDGAVLK